MPPGVFLPYGEATTLCRGEDKNLKSILLFSQFEKCKSFVSI